MIEILHGDNLDILPTLPSSAFDLIYIDPPFNTGKRQKRTRVMAKPDEAAERQGFGGRSYRLVPLGTKSFADCFDDYLAFLEPRIQQARRLLKPTGSFFLHLDYREVHYAKVLVDALFGRECFMNEIIWAYDYGARSRRRWPAKHDTILWYVVDPKRFTFNFEAMDRLPYMAPKVAGEAKAARGKTPTDVWWNTIVPTNSRERTGYPTQKPLAIIERIVKVHSNRGDRLLDFFAGSGTLGAAAMNHGRNCVLIDKNIEAVMVMQKRLGTGRETMRFF